MKSLSRVEPGGPAASWCFSTLGCPDLTLEQVFALAEKWRFDAVEVRALENSINLVNVFEHRYGEPAGLARLRENLPVRIGALDASMHLRNAKQQDREELLALARWADALGVQRLRVFDGGRDEAELTAEARDDMLRTFDWWRAEKQRAKFHCDLMVETHWILTNPRNCQELVHAAAAPMGILWDSFHTWAHASDSLGETWKLLRPHVCHIHLRDGVRDPATREGARYTLPGLGSYPLKALCGMVKADNYSGWISFEWERYWHPELPALDEALAAGRVIGLW